MYNATRTAEQFWIKFGAETDYRIAQGYSLSQNFFWWNWHSRERSRRQNLLNHSIVSAVKETKKCILQRSVVSLCLDNNIIFIHVKLWTFCKQSNIQSGATAMWSTLSSEDCKVLCALKKASLKETGLVVAKMQSCLPLQYSVAKAITSI